VSGAFHSPLMSDAAKKFSLFLEKIPFNEPIFPVVSNATGNYATSARRIKDNLRLQMDHPVLWEKSMRVLMSDNFTTFMEVGPGKVLQGLMKKIDRKVEVKGSGLEI
ncbi:ACP S-malonyltransferase, partial [Candidatus Aerophobetes bacterium]|nr:ACP S-malonyltransferase [Candidatus Aerophobetes bacterium]